MTTKPKNLSSFTAVLSTAVATLLLFGACGSSDNPNSTSTAGEPGGLSSVQVEALARGVLLGSSQGSSVGIQSTGIGIVKMKPDIVTISLGTEVIEKTVTEARNKTAISMAAMLAGLRGMGVIDDDIATTFFNIQPEYTFDQITETLPNGERIKRTERRLIGYRVHNSLSVKIRDLDKVGRIIDETVDAGGDATRLNNISFSVDNSSALEGNARTLALQDAVAKADLYAAATGVTRGRLTSIVETSSNQFSNQPRLKNVALAFEDAGPPTQILSGELEVRVTVKAVFDID